NVHLIHVVFQIAIKQERKKNAVEGGSLILVRTMARLRKFDKHARRLIRCPNRRNFLNITGSILLPVDEQDRLTDAIPFLWMKTLCRCGKYRNEVFFAYMRKCFP